MKPASNSGRFTPRSIRTAQLPPPNTKIALKLLDCLQQISARFAHRKRLSVAVK